MTVDMPTTPPQTAVQLIPWDPESPDHLQRLVLQRIACGWDKDYVTTKWRDLQRKGYKSIHWIVLSSSDAKADEHLIQKHLLNFPEESAPLCDTAVSLGGQSITPSSTLPFVPVGHISLDSDGADHAGKLSFDLKDIYRITNFYVSPALRGTGVGRQAMDALEKMAVEEPLCAKTLALNTAANDYNGWEVSYNAVGIPLPKYAVADWYGRRGYVEYKRVKDAFWHADITGKEWPFLAVYLKKDMTSTK